MALFLPLLLDAVSDRPKASNRTNVTNGFLEMGRIGDGDGERSDSAALIASDGDPDCGLAAEAKRKGDESSGRRERRSIGYDKIVLVIGRVRRDPPGQRSRGKVLFNGIVRPSTMLIPLGTRSLLGRLGH